MVLSQQAVHILLRHTNHEPVNRVLYEWNLHAYSVEHPLTEEEQAALNKSADAVKELCSVIGMA